MAENPTLNPEDTLKILIATDCHLGYKHSKVSGYSVDDTFDTFEEILQYAQHYNVDFILLGGDLFHDAKPTQDVMVKCMNLLRKYCLGPRETKIEFLSDPEYIFQHCLHKTVNYEDPNYNVSIPLFSIHGNHDDPSFSLMGAMDILSVSGMVNYFGKHTDFSQLTVAPLIIKKGETHLALYGLSYINDQRLSRLLRDYKVQMLRPSMDVPECFNMLVVHQNRVKHSDGNYIPETKWPSFLNFILWGHEHECRITPEPIEGPGYYICQPGSSVATSLSEGESIPKYVGLLKINKLNFNLKKLPLKTVRPFVFDNLILSQHNIDRDFAKKKCEAVSDFVDSYIENKLISKAATLLTGHPKQPIKPLIRLRVFYTEDEEVFDTTRISQKYYHEVANPAEMILMRKEKSGAVRRGVRGEINDDDSSLLDYGEIFSGDHNWNSSIQGNLKSFFSRAENRDELTVLTITGLNEALDRYTRMNDANAYEDVIRHQAKKTVEYLVKKDIEGKQRILQEIKKFRDERMADESLEEEAVIKVLNDKSRRITPVDVVELAQSSESDNDDNNSGLLGRGRGESKRKAAGPARGRGSRARGARGTRGRGKTATSGQSTSAKGRSAQQMQSTMQSFIASSSQARTGSGRMQFIDDSD